MLLETADDFRSGPRGADVLANDDFARNWALVGTNWAAIGVWIAWCSPPRQRPSQILRRSLAMVIESPATLARGNRFRPNPVSGLAKDRARILALRLDRSSRSRPGYLTREQLNVTGGAENSVDDDR